MNLKFIKVIFIFLFFIFGINKLAFSEVVNDIKIIGNERISEETIIMFSEVSINENFDSSLLNKTLKNLYETNFFENVTVKIVNNILEIIVKENPIIEKLTFNGIKAKRINELIKKNTRLKSRSSFNELILKKDEENIRSILKDLGYYFPKINTYVEKTKNNTVNVTYDIVLGDKAKINKITFIGDKKIKDKKLKSIIVSEENRFWKFITNRKFINPANIKLDKRLLKNYYLNKGHYQVKINDSTIELTENNNFKLQYNIDAGPKFKISKSTLILCLEGINCVTLPLSPLKRPAIAFTSSPTS